MRIEEDSLGEIEVPEDKYWGAQTERSLMNFPIGKEKIPLPVIYALTLIKKAAAIVNDLEKEKEEAIVLVSDQILAGKLDDQFPLVVWQTGSGTQSNMNVNEVIANLANETLGHPLGKKSPIHPNDDVNRSQSSNDTFPTAMHIASYLMITEKLLPALEKFRSALDEKARFFSEIIKVGRTHLMDATPITLGQEFSGYVSQIRQGTTALQQALLPLSELAIGGTAVGTGVNAPKDFDKRMCETLAQLTGYPFRPAPNKFSELSAHDTLVQTSGTLRRLAVSCLKIANDIRWLASGPRCGLNEITLPANEPGSSIMPGKVNPTQCESLTQVCAQVMGNDLTISFAGSQGNFQLNVYKPVIIYNLLQSVELLSDSINSFTDRLVIGIEANEEKIAEYLEKSLMLATLLNREIGYDSASQIVKKAFKENLSLKEASLDLGLLTAEQFDAIIDPKKMI